MQSACGAVCLDLGISLGMWITADLRLCDKLGLLVFYSCSWRQLAVQEDLRGLMDSELRVGVVDTSILEPRQVIACKTRIPLYHEKPSEQGWTRRICKNQHGDARSVLVIQKRTMYEDCSGPDKPTEDAERRLNICHMRVNGGLSVSLVFGSFQRS